MSAEQSIPVASRKTIAFNVNDNDAKIRNNRAVRFKTLWRFGCRWLYHLWKSLFQGDNQATSDRTAGIVIARNFTNTVITGNYIDNCFIEWSDELDPSPDGSGQAFSGLTISNNFCLFSHLDYWFNAIRLVPYNSGHTIDGLTITGNSFKCSSGNIDRIEGVDTTFASLDTENIKEFIMKDNSFINIDNPTPNPVTLEVEKTSANDTWAVELENHLPFGLKAKNVTSIVAKGAIRNASNQNIFTQPYTLVEQGNGDNEVAIKWSTAVKGSVVCTVRGDNLSTQKT